MAARIPGALPRQYENMKGIDSRLKLLAFILVVAMFISGCVAGRKSAAKPETPYLQNLKKRSNCDSYAWMHCSSISDNQKKDLCEEHFYRICMDKK